MANQVKFKSYAKRVLSELQRRELAALHAIGLQMSENIAAEITTRHLIDTGALQGSPFHKVDENKKSVYNGSDLEYAIYQNEGTSTGIKPQHFMQDAYLNNKKQIQEIAEEYLDL